MAVEPQPAVIDARRAAMIRHAALIMAPALATCAWWYMFWSGHPNHFDVHDVMAARASLAAHQPEQNESTRVLFPWVYVGFASFARPKLALTLAQCVAALTFFSGCLALYRRQRPHAPWMEQIAAMSVLCFYSASAYQAINRYGELLAPGLLAHSLAATSEAVALGVVLLLGLQRLDYGALSLFVFGLENIRRRLAFRSLGRAIGRTVPVIAVAVFLSLAIERDPSAPNQLPFTHEIMAQQAAVALNPNTWVWYSMYLLPAALFAASLDGGWALPLVAGIVANLALTLTFGAWSEFRLLLPSAIFLVCARQSDRGPDRP